MHHPIPGVFDLLTTGVSTYKERAKVLLSIVVIQLLLLGVMMVVFAVFRKVVSDITIPAVVLGAIGVVLLLWSNLALVHAVRGAHEKLSLKDAYLRAKSQVGAFIWTNVVVLFSLVGLLGFGAFLPAALVWYVLGTGLAIAVGVVLLFAELIVFGTWFCLTNYVVVDQGKSGIHALVESQRLVTGNFWRVLGRIAGTTIIYGIVLSIVGALLSAIASLVVGAEHTPAVKSATNQILGFLASPLLIGVFYTLYSSLKHKEEHQAPSLRGWVMAAAIGGVLVLVLCLAGGGYFLATR